MGRYQKAEQVYKQQFARRLRTVFAANDVSTIDIAGLIGLTPSSMYDYLNGESLPKAYAIAKICSILDIDANDLLGIKKVDK